MRVSDVMVSDVLTVGPLETIPKVARLMSQREASSILIVEGGKPVGIATERDFLERLLSKGKDPKKTAIKEIMSSPLVTMSPDMGTIEALRLMKKTRYSQLPVMKGNKLVGVVSLTDLMLFLSTFFSAQNL